MSSTTYNLTLSLKTCEVMESGEALVTWTRWTDKYNVPRELIRKYGETIIGTIINYRHIDPKGEADSFLDEVVDARVLFGGKELEVDTLLENDTEFHFPTKSVGKLNCGGIESDT